MTQDSVPAPNEASTPKKRAGGLNGMLIADLKSLAAGLGIAGAGGMRKAQLVDAIKAAQSSSQASGQSSGQASDQAAPAAQLSPAVRLDCLLVGLQGGQLPAALAPPLPSLLPFGVSSERLPCNAQMPTRSIR